MRKLTRWGELRAIPTRRPSCVTPAREFASNNNVTVACRLAQWLPKRATIAVESWLKSQRRDTPHDHRLAGVFDSVLFNIMTRTVKQFEAAFASIARNVNVTIFKRFLRPHQDHTNPLRNPIHQVEHSSVPSPSRSHPPLLERVPQIVRDVAQNQRTRPKSRLCSTRDRSPKITTIAIGCCSSFPRSQRRLPR